jgi:deoxycytidine triphosphate deaminase
MSDLSDRDILAAMADGEIVCQPFNRANLSAASIDLRLGAKIYRRKMPLLNRWFPRLFPLPVVNFDIDENGRVTVIRKAEDFELINLSGFHYAPDEETYTLYPGDFILAPTLEYVGQNSAEIQSEVCDKSTLARLGLSVCFSAGFVDAGNALHVTLELKNNGHEPIRLRYAQHICQIKFARLSSPSMQPYDGKYKNSKTVECAK